MQFKALSAREQIDLQRLLSEMVELLRTRPTDHTTAEDAEKWHKFANTALNKATQIID
jgi:hypothetical protein